MKSIIIPFYNEENRLKNTLKTIIDYIYKLGEEVEIIAIDDGSNDSSISIAKKFEKEYNFIRILRNKNNMGKGYSIRKGIRSATGDLILITDADLSTPVEEMKKLTKVIKEGSDIAIGSRRIKGAEVKITFIRRLNSFVFNLFTKLILGLNIKDTQCGFKMFKKDVAKYLFNKQIINRFGFDMEILFLAKKFGYKIKEVPIKWRFQKGSKVRFLIDAPSMFLDLIKIKLNFIRGIYK